MKYPWPSYSVGLAEVGEIGSYSCLRLFDESANKNLGHR